MIILCLILRGNDMDINAHLTDRIRKAGAILMIPAMLVVLRIPTVLKLRGYYFSTTAYWLYSFSMSAYQMRIIPPVGYASDDIPVEYARQEDKLDTFEYPNVLFL